ncbi:hypothetical protein ACFLXN_01435 [Chloroflexota bacterium]
MVWSPPPFPVGDPREPIPKDKSPKIPRRMSGGWDESAVEHDLSFVREAGKILDAAENVIQSNDGSTNKKSLRRELEHLGWIYNRGTTFMANFPFRGKYIVFDFAIINEGALNIHRVEIVMRHGGVSSYRLMKWMPKLKVGWDITETLSGLFSTKKGLMILAICLMILIALLLWWSFATEIE